MDVLDRADLPFPHSLPEFQRLFPDDAACAAYLEKARWGDGFACPHCGTAGEPFHFENRPGVLRCRKCRQNGIVKLTDCRLFSAFLHEAKPLKLRKAVIDNLPIFRGESG